MYNSTPGLLQLPGQKKGLCKTQKCVFLTQKVSELRSQNSTLIAPVHVRSVAQTCLTLLHPHGQQPTRLLCPWNFPGKNIGVSSHFLLQGIFPIQGSNFILHLLHWQADSLLSVLYYCAINCCCSRKVACQQPRGQLYRPPICLPKPTDSIMILLLDPLFTSLPNLPWGHLF